MSENWKIFWVGTWFTALVTWIALLLPAWQASNIVFDTVVKTGIISLVIYLVVLLVFLRPAFTNSLKMFMKYYFLLLCLLIALFYTVSVMWGLTINDYQKLTLASSYVLVVLTINRLSNILVKQLSWPHFLKFTRKSTIEDWLATKTPREQGVDAQQLPIPPGLRLKSMEFEVRSNSNYWRAGIKFADKDGEAIPLRQDNSTLFHLYKDIEFTNHISTRTYITKDNATDTIVEKNASEIFHVRAAINERNVLKIYVDDKEEFSHQYDEKIFSQVYILAWGDHYDYSVEFSKIKYLIR